VAVGFNKRTDHFCATADSLGERGILQIFRRSAPSVFVFRARGPAQKVGGGGATHREIKSQPPCWRNEQEGGEHFGLACVLRNLGRAIGIPNGEPSGEVRSAPILGLTVAN